MIVDVQHDPFDILELSNSGQFTSLTSFNTSDKLSLTIKIGPVPIYGLRTVEKYTVASVSM